MVLVTNPVDVLTRIAIETSARPAHLILGCGTVLDGARLRQRLGELLDVERESVHAYVVGEHGDSSMLQHSAAILEQAYRSLTAGETTAGSETAPGRRGG